MKGRFLNQEDQDHQVTRIRGTQYPSGVIDISYIGDVYILKKVIFKDGMPFQYELEPYKIIGGEFLNHWTRIDSKTQSKIKQYLDSANKVNNYISDGWSDTTCL